MKSNVSVFAKKITTVHTGNDLGRFCAVEPLSSIVSADATGTCVEFRDRSGKVVCGIVVDVRDDMRSGKFPTYPEDVIILDTSTPEQVHVRKMATGGYRGTSGAKGTTKGIL